MLYSGFQESSMDFVESHALDWFFSLTGKMQVIGFILMSAKGTVTEQKVKRNQQMNRYRCLPSKTLVKVMEVLFPSLNTPYSEKKEAPKSAHSFPSKVFLCYHGADPYSLADSAG